MKIRLHFLFTRYLLAFLLCCCMTYIAQSQNASAIDTNLIERNKDFFLLHDIHLGNYRYNNPDMNLALQQALKSKKSNKSRNVAGGILLGYGVISFITGIATLPRKKDKGTLGGEVQNSFAVGMVAFGLVGAGASIPLFVGAKNKKKDMEKALQQAKRLQGQ